MYCSNCDDEIAIWQCSDCEADFCTECDQQLHKPRKMESHQRTQKVTRNRPKSARPLSARPQSARNRYGESKLRSKAD